MPSWGYNWVILVELKVFPEILQLHLQMSLGLYLFYRSLICVTFILSHAQMVTDSFNKNLIVPRTCVLALKDRPPWEAMRGSITWRKYGLRNMSRGQLEGDKVITCSKV